MLKLCGGPKNPNGRFMLDGPYWTVSFSTIKMFNDVFDCVYVLNLSSRPDRMKAMTERLARAGIRFERHEALPGSVVRHYYGLVQHSRPFSNANYVACSLSHLAIWTKALASGHKNICILEDDVLIHREADALLRTFVDQVRSMSPTWDLLYLSYIPLTDDEQQWSYVRLDGQKITGKPNLRGPGGLWSLMGYGISERLMRHMLEVYQKSMPMEIDRYFVKTIQKDPAWAVWAIAPQVIAGHDGFSDNSHRHESGLFEKSCDSRLATAADFF